MKESDSMAGPGGGSRGGGFGGGSRGGFSGGSRGGFVGGHHHSGGFYGGGHYPSPMHHHHGPFYRGGRFYSIFSFFITILIIVCCFIFFSLNLDFDDDTRNGEYSEELFQEYTNEWYESIFGESTCYEDNILIVFLTTDENDGYYTIAWVGDNINYQITDMFGNEQTEFGDTMTNSINDYHCYSLGGDLARVIDKMTDKVVALGLDSSFKEPSDHTKVAYSKIYNYSNCQFTVNTVNNSLENFTEKTGIPICIVVDNETKVFGDGSTVTEQNQNPAVDVTYNEQQENDQSIVDETQTLPNQQNEDSSIGIIGGADGPTTIIIGEQQLTSNENSSKVFSVSKVILYVVLIGAIILTVFWIKRSKKKEKELMDQGRITMHNPKDNDLQ